MVKDQNDRVHSLVAYLQTKDILTPCEKAPCSANLAISLRLVMCCFNISEIASRCYHCSHTLEEEEYIASEQVLPSKASYDQIR